MKFLIPIATALLAASAAAAPVAKRQDLRDTGIDLKLSFEDTEPIGSDVSHAITFDDPPGTNVKRQFLDDLSPDAATLEDGLGLATLSPGLEGALDTLGTDEHE